MSVEGKKYKIVEIACPECEGRGFTHEVIPLSGVHWRRVTCKLCKGDKIVEMRVPA